MKTRKRKKEKEIEITKTVTVANLRRHLIVGILALLMEVLRFLPMLSVKLKTMLFNPESM